MNLVIGDRQQVKLLFCVDTIIIKQIHDSEPLLCLCLLLDKNGTVVQISKLFADLMLIILLLSATASDPAPFNS